jgi:hypothetical protein
MFEQWFKANAPVPAGDIASVAIWALDPANSAGPVFVSGRVYVRLQEVAK